MRICGLLWLKMLLKILLWEDLGISTEGPMSMRLFCDNKDMISIANDLVRHDRTNHIEIDKTLHNG